MVVGVAFQARWLARLAAAARVGLDVETIVEPELFLEDIELAATLPAHALRYLFEHSGVHLNVEWRDLPDEGWTRTVRSLDGRSVRIDATPLMRAREIWKAAATLNGSWRSSDIPAAMSGPSDSARPWHDGRPRQREIGDLEERPAEVRALAETDRNTGA